MRCKADALQLGRSQQKAANAAARPLHPSPKGCP